MDSQGLVFELQWKKKHGVGNQGGVIGGLGIWDSADSSLDYKTFKSYLSQNLGTSEDISVAYVDSEGDELPIDSECEFEEALKFARQRSRNGRNIILKVAKEECFTKLSAEGGRSQFKPHTKHSTNICIAESDDKSCSCKQVKTTNLEDLIIHNRTLIEKLDLQQQTNEDQVQPPAWFKSYMLQMKTEIVDEVNAHTRQLLSSASIAPMIGYNARISDEESSNAALGGNERDHKLLKKIEKLQKREKKLEKKLENKMKKKTTPNKAQQRVLEKKRCSDVGIVLIDVMVLHDEPKCEMHINLGKQFTKIWEIMNNGTLSWTDKTELRLAWGSQGLEPHESVVKCPLLEPGEKGQIAVNFRAPDFPGMFESYWHFYHMGERFGHWIGCAVSVEGILMSDDVNNIAVDLTMKCKSDSDSDKFSVSSDSDDDKFVVVPMPSCFLQDIPITQSVQDANQTFNVPEVDGAESSLPLPPPITVPKITIANTTVPNGPIPNVPISNVPIPNVPIPNVPIPIVPVPSNPVSYNPVPNNPVSNIPILNVPVSNNPVPNVHNIKTDTIVNEAIPNTSVQILPETIVNGAINVATSAFSTAKAVLSNLRSMPSVGSEWQASRQEMSTSDCQKLLVDMGFQNLNLNLLLLQRYNNDVAKVVAELLQSQILEFD